ncbi:hypothetical protein ACFWYW_11925 [Nonomuraea sp. NPDC059023]|uniref:hypothetical protein n=1 Tax=unclassified Nonomuraea TaxID=2593643 RepID=UPI0036C385D2
MRLRRLKQHDASRDLARKRLARLPIPDALSWGDVCLAGVWRELEDYRKDSAPHRLDEARRGLQSMLGLMDDLQNRLP